jgi:OOP family OmpA-OmpF porin
MRADGRGAIHVRQRTDAHAQRAYKRPVHPAQTCSTHLKETMNLTPAFRLLGLASLGALIAAPAPALAQDTSHTYVGVSVGQSRTEVDANGITSGLLPGVSATSSSTDEKDTAYKVFGGYQFNRNLAIEGGYFNLGNNSFSAVTSPAGTLAGETKAQGLNLDLVGTLPLTERFSALARIGAHHTWSKSTFSGTGAAATAAGGKRDDGGYKVGLGLQYELNPSMWVRGELERYRVKNATGQRANVDLLSVSLVFPFGRAPAPRRAAAPAYVPPVVAAPVVAAPVVAYTPPPVAPVPVAVVVPPAPQRVNLSADALFGSNQSVVRQQGQTDLDQFRQQLSGATYDTIRVEGHTDRMGSDTANQTLSDARAASVKDYLVIHGRIDPARISASGMGERQPVTAAADCPDSLPRARLIECLQPDRRVEIEVTGTR